MLVAYLKSSLSLAKPLKRLDKRDRNSVKDRLVYLNGTGHFVNKESDEFPAGGAQSKFQGEDLSRWHRGEKSESMAYSFYCSLYCHFQSPQLQYMPWNYLMGWMQNKRCS